jgi:hypothetical protein
MAYYTTGLNPNLGSDGVIEHTVALTAATGTTAGAVVSIANPLGVDLLIVDAILRTTTESTGAATVDIGVAAGAATASDTLFDGLSLATAAKIADARNDTDTGTNGLVPRLWPAASFVTGTASATLAGMVGRLHLVCIRA